jgi:polyhydroxybutyrate depolymerase
VSIQFDGRARSYLLSRPAVSTTPLPVLLELHGCCISPNDEEQRSGFMRVTGPAILVYPAGIGQSWNVDSCCEQAHTNGVDDVGFITAVLRQIRTSQPAARGPVYLAGYSKGGRMALLLACAVPRMFAAVAVYAAVSSSPCALPRPTSLLEMASTGDSEITIGTGARPHNQSAFVEPTVVAQVASYLVANGCASSTSIAVLGNLTNTLWAHCQGEERVQLSIYSGGGHGWPQSSGETPSAQQVMWAFFTSIRAHGS